MIKVISFMKRKMEIYEKNQTKKHELELLIRLGVVIETKDKYTGGHVWRVSQYAKLIGEALSLDKKQLYILELGGILHDVGKIGVPDSVLNKPERLTDDEFEVMKSHVNLGEKLIENNPIGKLVLEMVRDHHKYIDGRGYNQGTKSKLNIEAKIMAVADAFDAMTSTRPYRKAMDADKAIRILVENIGTQFDKTVVKTMETLFAEGKLKAILGYGFFELEMLHCDNCGPVIEPSHSHQHGDHLTCPTCLQQYTVIETLEGVELKNNGSKGTTYFPVINKDFINYMLDTCPIEFLTD